MSERRNNRRFRFSRRRDESNKSEHAENIQDGISGKNRKAAQKSEQERPRWVAPDLPAAPMITPKCPWCGNQINDITTAINDKETGLPVHFDCVLERITKSLSLEANDSVCYIGGGRFGIIRHNNPHDPRDFSVKQIIEWEDKEKADSWRKPICESFSVT